MALIDVWKSDRVQFDEKQVHQVIAFAGSGKLLEEVPRLTSSGNSWLL